MPDATVKRTPAHDALLKEGYDLLIKYEGDIGRVKMQDVAKRAGLTSGAFYNVWPGGLPAFQQSLLEFALAAEHISYLNDILSGLESVGPAVMPLTEVVRQFCARDVEHLKRDPGFRVQVALWARHGSDTSVANALRASYEELSGRYVEVYDAVLAAYGRAWRHPFTGISFATLLTALAEGLAMRNAVDPDNTPPELAPADSDAGGWELFGLATATLLASATRPVAGDDTSAWVDLGQLDDA